MLMEKNFILPETCYFTGIVTLRELYYITLFEFHYMMLTELHDVKRTMVHQ